MSRRKFDGDPFEALRRSDPLDPRDVPADTSDARARALFQEVTTMPITDTRTVDESPAALRAPRRRGLALAVAGSAVAVFIAAVAGAAALRGGGEEIVSGGVPLGSTAMCAEMYDPTTLGNRDVAFDGTVAAIDGTAVTFTVNRWFQGGTGENVTLEADGLIGDGTSSISVGGPGLEIGTRYLVSGSGGFVWACGFTMTYDSAIADTWATVFGG